MAVPPTAGARVPKVSLQVAGGVGEYRNQPVASPPPGFTVAWSTAESSTISEAATVATVGCVGGVVKVSTSPKTLPTEVEAMAQE
jgi:predicted ATPase